MRIQCSKKAVRARNRQVMAETEVAEEATDLLFETDDVAELLASATGEDVDVTVDGETVEFAVGEDVYTCEAEPTDETVESSTRFNKRKVAASSTIRRPAGKAVRKLPRRK